ncbi:MULTISPECIES: 7-carboxy-7-deazaguanine synthase QueE [unclassified Synechococcus]|uniref:7-carboxy-7-deazaguanine synthase QueE n=1 Tax=unclassified Synechococcus TaxID=2626047 RepID=UPI001648937E|nr:MULTISPECIES: 7-carboxy-7-deazaguanine synthase QueE [unclassified Synechococcus]MEC7248218.1 7-carboxy-7-deazaguanine synthase QueE [Cyanobacteriota bacterium]MEC7897360.1 7-carboxy-7-deazaguanine synthase QueE [Cyanobacteriota bacterium]MEC8095634.1 7-carboxy-7-deazaguanine synthase QueE [Cyanobacteriota bacterium]|tara:strand:+ start:910 stop:1515 length:606 start_codon:yes stop_codon:yes gene_type:complete
MTSLPVVETFHSLQGEGLHAGRSAFFIRLGGCHVGCSWCDTKHSWPMESHPKQSVDSLATKAAQAEQAGAAFVVITGGEPLHHNLNALTDEIRRSCHLPVHIETSGVDPLSGTIDWVTLSPKRHHPPLPELLSGCHELKVVIHEPEDLLFADVVSAQAPQAQWLLQPGWDSQEGQQLAVTKAQGDGRWRLSLQSHKWLGVR